ncbi:MAG: 3-deoxy-D-manno-octulosonic acid transferase [Acidobacteria bacterium]|nr:3-deoxy-D-manno-octulosonic acid transferase [Acidobacteriota bacterium]
MYLLYSLFLVFWGLLLLPVFLYRAWRYHKYLPGLSQRLGRLPACLRSDGRPTIWFHSCSVGETLSLQPVVENLRSRFPQARFVFSTITATGQTVARERFSSAGAGDTFYFPVDLSSIDRRVLDWIRPSMIVIVDTEIWPNLLNQARRRSIPVMLVNGRISAASFRHYRLAKRLLRRVFRNYRMLLMQSEEDARRIAGIGAPNEKIQVTGNIKFDTNLPLRAADTSLEAFVSADPEKMLIVAGSTHPGEEEILLEVLRRIRRTPALSRTRLLLAPRHPERFDETADLVARSGFTLRRRSIHSQPVSEDVLLLDTVGELAAVYRYATVVFIGGTLGRHGGHSIIEPALFSKAIVTGPSMENFRWIADEFRAKQGMRQITANATQRGRQADQLRDVMLDLLQNPDERGRLGRNAGSILENNRGAARRTADTIAAVFEETIVRSESVAEVKT